MWFINIYFLTCCFVRTSYAVSRISYVRRSGNKIHYKVNDFFINIILEIKKNFRIT